MYKRRLLFLTEANTLSRLKLSKPTFMLKTTVIVIEWTSYKWEIKSDWLTIIMQILGVRNAYPVMVKAISRLKNSHLSYSALLIIGAC